MEGYREKMSFKDEILEHVYKTNLIENERLMTHETKGITKGIKSLRR